mmetsp:Transcript_7413/g.12523  ORF Transcript_7413/g.12523 Transcript_7413/m.12523 type:complete len:577 (-) Transcript_7413:228-1958(-)
MRFARLLDDGRPRSNSFNAVQSVRDAVTSAITRPSSFSSQLGTLSQSSSSAKAGMDESADANGLGANGAADRPTPCASEDSSDCGAISVVQGDGTPKALIPAIVPAGAKPGDQFVIQSATGEQIAVEVPAGVHPGQVIHVRPPETTMVVTVSLRSAPFASAPDLSSLEEIVGTRDQVFASFKIAAICRGMLARKRWPDALLHFRKSSCVAAVRRALATVVARATLEAAVRASIDLAAHRVIEYAERKRRLEEERRAAAQRAADEAAIAAALAEAAREANERVCEMIERAKRQVRNLDTHEAINISQLDECYERAPSSSFEAARDLSRRRQATDGLITIAGALVKSPELLAVAAATGCKTATVASSAASSTAHTQKELEVQILDMQNEIARAQASLLQMQPMLTTCSAELLRDSATEGDKSDEQYAPSMLSQRVPKLVERLTFCHSELQAFLAASGLQCEIARMQANHLARCNYELGRFCTDATEVGTAILSPPPLQQQEQLGLSFSYCPQNLPLRSAHRAPAKLAVSYDDTLFTKYAQGHDEDSVSVVCCDLNEIAQASWKRMSQWLHSNREWDRI